MKIRLVEIEANAKELQAGNTLADNFSNLLSSCFRQPISDDDDEEIEDDRD